MGKNLKALIFSLSGEYFAANMGQVERVIEYDGVIKIPELPNFVEGLIRDEDKVIPIINMNKKFSINKNKEEAKKIIIIKREEKKFGIIVENAYEVKDISEEEIEGIPEIVSDIGESYIKGIIKLDGKIIVFLELEKILKREDEEKIF